MSALSAVLSTLIGRSTKFRNISCTECTFQGNDFNWFQRKKRKLKIPKRIILVVNFLRSVIIAEIWRPEVAIREKVLRIFFCVLGKNDPLRKNFQNYVLEVFIMTPIDVLCSNFVKFSRREIGEIVRCLSDKNSPGSPAVATARIAPKICQDQPPTMHSECSRFHTNRFTFGWVIVERVNTAKTRRKVNPMFG